jgi:hypothetical protein
MLVPFQGTPKERELEDLSENLLKNMVIVQNIFKDEN